MGLFKALLALWNENDAISFDILATNMHLLASHGNTYREIENDGFSIKYKVIWLWLLTTTIVIPKG